VSPKEKTSSTKTQGQNHTAAEGTYRNYQPGFPRDGTWHEVFNSDLYNHWPNPEVAGNGGEISADGGPMHGLPASAAVTLPANGLLIFALDQDDN
jgi:1,4-alpha-glucan branching enzyme